MNEVKTSIIIPTYNKRARLVLMLKSIERLKNAGNCEFIFVNDGSTDDTVEILISFKEKHKGKLAIKIINIANGGRSVARNTGLRMAKGDLIIFTDDDVILDPEFVYQHELAHLKADNLAVHGMIYSLPYLKFFKDPVTGELYEGGMAKGMLLSKRITCEMFADNSIDNYLKSNSKLSKFELDIQKLYEDTAIEDAGFRFIGFTGGNISVLRKNLEKINGFDDKMGRLWGCEDIETGYRLYLSGLKFKYDKSIINYHINHFRKNANEVHTQAIKYFINKHDDKKLKELEKYFSGELASLIEWKNNTGN